MLETSVSRALSCDVYMEIKVYIGIMKISIRIRINELHFEEVKFLTSAFGYYSRLVPEAIEMSWDKFLI